MFINKKTKLNVIYLATVIWDWIESNVKVSRNTGSAVRNIGKIYNKFNLNAVDGKSHIYCMCARHCLTNNMPLKNRDAMLQYIGVCLQQLFRTAVYLNPRARAMHDNNRMYNKFLKSPFWTPLVNVRRLERSNSYHWYAAASKVFHEWKEKEMAWRQKYM